MKQAVWIWFKAAAVRAIKTAAQTALAIASINSTIMQDVDWLYVASAAGLAALLSLLMSVAGLPEALDGKSLPQLSKELSRLHAGD